MRGQDFILAILPVSLKRMVVDCQRQKLWRWLKSSTLEADGRRVQPNTLRNLQDTRQQITAWPSHRSRLCCTDLSVRGPYWVAQRTQFLFQPRSPSCVQTVLAHAQRLAQPSASRFRTAESRASCYPILQTQRRTPTTTLLP